MNRFEVIFHKYNSRFMKDREEAIAYGKFWKCPVLDTETLQIIYTPREACEDLTMWIDISLRIESHKANKLLATKLFAA